MGALLGDGYGVGVSNQARSRGSSRRIYKFGVFELGVESGELWKHGTRIKLQIKPLQVLIALLERPGELVTREQLCKKLWPAGTFVDFESGLNTATNRLRSALGDSAECPRYIETLPRLGYRFICPVTEIERSKPERVATLAGQAVTEGSPTPAQKAAIPKPDEIVEPPVADILAKATAKSGTRQHPLRRFLPWIGLSTGPLVLALTSAHIYSRFNTTPRQPVFRELTFRSGEVGPARFTADSQNAIYSARWTNGDTGIYLEPLQSFESRRLAFAGGVVDAVSRDGNLAFSSTERGSASRGIQVSRVSLGGGIAQVIAEDAKLADWAPDGHELALLRQHGPDSTIEFPEGHSVYTSHGWIDGLRVSPRGDQVAFFEHPVRDDSAGYLRVVDRNGHTRALTEEWSNAEGLAWSPSGGEIWFTGSKTAARGVLYAVSGTGKLRQVSDTPSSLRLLDMSTTGRVLLATDDTRLTLMASFPGEKSVTDLTKFDVSYVDDISPDGNLVLFTEGGDAGGEHYAVYVHNHKTGSTTQIGSGRGLALSPDGNWVLTVDPRDRRTLTITSVDSRVSKKVFGYGFVYQWAKFFGSGSDILAGGAYPGGSLAICNQKIEGGKPVPVNDAPYLDHAIVSPDGSRFAGLDSHRRTLVFDVGKRTALTAIPETARFPVAWSKDSNSLYVVTVCDSNYMIAKLDVKSGRAEPWKAISTGESTFTGFASVVAAPEADTYAYSGHTNFSHLYVVDGWS